MKRLILIPPDGAQQELTPDNPANDLYVEPVKGHGVSDIWEAGPNAVEGDARRWHGQVPDTWAIINGD